MLIRRTIRQRREHNMIYLDNAATTFPKPEAVYDAMMDCMKNYCANPGRAGHKLAMKAAREIYDTRENIAKLFNIDNPMNIVFTNNATDSLNLSYKRCCKCWRPYNNYKYGT